MKRITEEGWAIIAVMKDGSQFFQRPFKQTREDARKWIAQNGQLPAVRFNNGAVTGSVKHYRVAPVRVTELTPKLKKKIKISLTRGARRAK